MGTPEFAVPSLEALLKSDDQVVGLSRSRIVRRAAGNVLTPSPVKVVAQREQNPDVAAD